MLEWLKMVFLPWLVTRDVRKKWLLEMSAANELVERASKIARKVKYVKIDKQDENGISYLEEIATIAANECFVYQVYECRQALLEQLMRVGSAKIEKRTAKVEDDNRVEIVTIEDPEKEIARIKYMMSGIEFLELAMTSQALKLAQLRSGGNNAQISL